MARPDYSTIKHLARKTTANLISPASVNPSGGTTGQVLKKNSSTDYDYDWDDDSTGDGGGTYSILKAKGNMSSASFDDTENAISWTESFNSGSDVSLSGSEITISNTGTYKFSVTLRTTNGNRTELFIRTYINTGGGLVQDSSEIVSDYVSRDSDQNTGAVNLVTALELDAADVIEFRGFGDTDGSCAGVDDGTILIVERVA